VAVDFRTFQRDGVVRRGTPQDVSCGQRAGGLSHQRTAHAAALAGVNLVPGVRRGGRIDLGSGIHLVGPAGDDGPVDLVFTPSAVHLTPFDEPRPDGAWQSTLTGVEAVGDHARAHLGPPILLHARLPVEQLQDGLQRDTRVWVRIDPADVSVHPSRSAIGDPRPSPSSGGGR
jgi:hypothetical protein